MIVRLNISKIVNHEIVLVNIIKIFIFHKNVKIIVTFALINHLIIVLNAVKDTF